jgi:S-(hydroxymethyl)glutathione dehydrogenase/alcohol dehydrogenase
MRVVMLTGPDTLEIEELAVPTLRPTEVLVRVTASGLCHSDLHNLREPARFQGPTILGHEVAGVVEDVGRSVTSLGRGDRVIGSWVPACGVCPWCLGGQTHLCRELWEEGRSPRLERADGSLARRATGLGAFAEMMVVGERSAVKVETELPDEQLALVGCGVTTGVGAVLNTAQVTPGSSVVVFGCGGVGQAVVQGARVAGAATIMAVDPVPAKLRFAAASGATHTIDARDPDVVGRITDLTGGRGADFTFEVSGRADGLAAAWAATRRGGTLVPVGAQQPTTLNPWPAYEQLFQEKRVLGCLYGSAEMRRDFPLILRLVEAGRLDIGFMVTRTLTLDEVSAGLDAIEQGEVIRQVMIP